MTAAEHCALLRFSDVLAAQTRGELPYAQLKQLLRALKSMHPRYPRRAPRPVGCSQIFTLSQTQATQRVRTQGRDLRDGRDDYRVVRLEGGDEGLSGSDDDDDDQGDVEQDDRDRGLCHALNTADGFSEEDGSELPGGAVLVFGDGTDCSEHATDQPAHDKTRGLVSQSGNGTPADDVSQPSAAQGSYQTLEDVWSTPSALVGKDSLTYKSPKNRRAASVAESQAGKENQPTISNPLVSLEISPQQSTLSDLLDSPDIFTYSPALLSSDMPGKRSRISSSPPSYLSVGVEINAILNSLIGHDLERGESVKWLHLRHALLDKDAVLYEPFCKAMDRVFEPRDPLAAYNAGAQAGSSQSSTRMCVFYSDLFWQDAWREFCYDCRRKRKSKKGGVRVSPAVQFR